MSLFSVGRALVVLPLLFTTLAPNVSRADLTAEWAKREAALAAAKDPFDKAKALLLHASVPIDRKDTV